MSTFSTVSPSKGGRPALVGVRGSFAAQARQVVGEDSGLLASAMIIGSRQREGWPYVVAAALEALNGTTALIWHVSAGGDRTPRIQQRTRALGRHPGVVDGNPEAQLSIVAGSSRLYADIGRLRMDEAGAVAKFLARSSAPVDSVVAFFRKPGPRTLERWTGATLGLVWLWSHRSLETSFDGRAHSAATVFVTFIHETIAAGGVAMVLIPTEDAGRLLWFVGSPDEIASAERRLEGASTVIWKESLSDVSKLWSFTLA